jgi:hypothetical protein
VHDTDGRPADAESLVGSDTIAITIRFAITAVDADIDAFTGGESESFVRPTQSRRESIRARPRSSPSGGTTRDPAYPGQRAVVELRRRQ